MVPNVAASVERPEILAGLSLDAGKARESLEERKCWQSVEHATLTDRCDHNQVGVTAGLIVFRECQTWRRQMSFTR